MKRQSLISQAIIVLCSSVAVANAQNPDDSTGQVAPIRLAVASQPIAAALNDFARQSGLHVVIGSEVAAGVKSAPVEGTFTPEAALQQLLMNTGLRYEYLDAQTVAVLGKEKPRAEVRNGTKTFRVAQVSSSLQGDGSGQVLSADQGAEESVKSSQQQIIDEIVVTAQKREERLQDVPISISVLTGDTLDKSTVQDVTEALSSVPGVAVEEGFQGGTTQLTVRGVSAASPGNNGASPIGYYIDSVPFGFVRSATMPDPDVYDLDRIEVLRGPQGTLYGASSLNGVIRVLTKDANPDKFEFKARGLSSSTEDGGMNYRGDMAVNVPLIEGKLAARAVLGYQDLSGWIDKPAREDANDAERRNARVKLNAQLTEQLSMGLSAWVSRDDFGAHSLSGDNMRDPAPDTEKLVNDFETYGLNIGYDFSAFTLASSTSYIDFFNSGYIVFNNVTGAAQLTEMSANTFSQEINLASRHVGPWRWTSGLMYRDSQDRRFQVQGTAQNIVFLSESWAVFGELTRSFADGQLELTGGLRYFEDEVGLREKLRFGAVQPAQYVNRDTKFSSTTPRVILTWKPSERLTAYASYAEGFRSGADQLPAVIAAVPSLPGVDPDELTNYELGAKGNWLDGRLGFDAAVYYLDWQDVQLPLIVLVDGIERSALLNGQSASGLGTDLILTARPATGLELGVSFSWNDLEMDSDARAGTIVAYSKGDRLNASPDYTVGASADYTFPLGGDGLEGQLSAAYNLTAVKEYRFLVGTAVTASESDRIGVGRLSFAVNSSDRWVATLFVDNISNEKGAVSRAGTSQSFRPDSAMRMRPRTIGVQVDFHY